VIIVLALTAAVGFYYAYQARAVRSEAMQHLQTIARMKAGQVSTWRLDRLQDGERLAGDQQVAALVSEWLADSRDEHAALLRDRLLNESLSEGYESLLLADVTGRVLWTPMGQDEVLAEEAIVGVETAAARAKPVLTDLHSSTDSHGVHADIVVPVMSRRPELHVMAVIVMRVSADDFLYPLVDSRPNERGTAETLLFAEGSDLPMLLSGPRTGAAALASARTRVTEADAVQIRRLLARHDVVDSIEYRGHEAIAVATPIVGSSWFLVAKIDRDEAFPPWSSAPFSLLLNAIGIGGIVAISAAAIWHRSDARNLAIMLQVESDRMRSDQRYAATLRSVGDAVVSTDDEGRIEYMNPVAERLTGYEREEALGRPLDDLLEFVEESTGESVVSPLRALAPGDAPRPGRLLLRTRDADLRAVALRTAPIRDD
jgi:PAS domain S-box-containing protein